MQRPRDSRGFCYVTDKAKIQMAPLLDASKCVMPRKMWTAGLVTQSLVYIAGGINHFAMRRLYMAIMPAHYSHAPGWVELTGVAEIAGGLGLLLPATRRPAAWGIIAMLLVYFDVHFFMLQHAGRFAPIPKWALEARIPLQFVLIAWAYVYTRKAAAATRA